VINVPDGEQPITTITAAYIHQRFAPPHQKVGLAPETWSKARLAFIRRKIDQWLGRDY
jgi:hypothetical protein